jgi:hypothetical protein
MSIGCGQSLGPLSGFAVLDQRQTDPLPGRVSTSSDNDSMPCLHQATGLSLGQSDHQAPFAAHESEKLPVESKAQAPEHAPPVHTWLGRVAATEGVESLFAEPARVRRALALRHWVRQRRPRQRPLDARPQKAAGRR